MSQHRDDAPRTTGPERTIETEWNDDRKTFDVYVRKRDAQGSLIKIPQTAEDFDQLVPPPRLEIPPAETLSENFLDLLARADYDAASLSEADKLEILDWKSDQSADADSLEKCGLTWQDLITKGLERPAELTRDEAHQIAWGRNMPDDAGDIFMKRSTQVMRQPEPIQELWHRAQDAAKGSRHRSAEIHAHEQLRNHSSRRHEAMLHLSEEDRKSIQIAKRMPSIKYLASCSTPHWGFVCIRASYKTDEEWNKYKQHLLNSAVTGLWSCFTPDMITKKWKLEFIEDDEAHLSNISVTEACKYFKDPPPGSHIPAALESGLRHDIFLLADGDSIASMHDPPSDPWWDRIVLAPDAPPPETDHLIPGFIKAVDASYEPSNEYDHGFEGVLKVHPAHLATTFYHRLKQRGEEPPPESQDRWRYKQTIDTMYLRANGGSKREGGVYPPHSMVNK